MYTSAATAADKAHKRKKSGIRQLRVHLTKIKDNGTAPQVHCSVVVLVSRDFSLSDERLIYGQPLLTDYLVTICLTSRCITGSTCVCVYNQRDWETEAVMVWWDKVIRTLLRASLWVIRSLTGTAMLVINTLNYQGSNVCLCVCVCLHECAFPIRMVVCLIMSVNYQWA